MGFPAEAEAYINFIFANGGLIIPSFGDPADDPAYKVFQGLFPDRRVVQIMERAKQAGLTRLAIGTSG